MFLKPKWYTMLPEHLKPANDKVKRLEAFRKRLDLPHEALFMGIGISPWAVVKTQEYTLKDFRQKFPQLSEKELWRAVLASRFQVKLAFPAPGDLPLRELMRRMEHMDDIMKNIHTFDDLVSYILEMDKNILSTPFPDYSGIQDEINQILKE
ncbi:MAG TPA: hypothetical protein DEP99_00100 [Nitrospiraceae bacterium]|nr:hypothetical protein [Nitrospiraceae bacterium]